MALLEKAVRQGHVYAMHAMGVFYEKRKEHDHAMEWYTKAGAYTRSLFSSTEAVSDAQKHPTHPKHPLPPP